MALLHCLCFVACDVTVIFLLTCDFSDVDSKHDEYVVPYQAGWCYMKAESVWMRKVAFWTIEIRFRSWTQCTEQRRQSDSFIVILSWYTLMHVSASDVVSGPWTPVASWTQVPILLDSNSYSSPTHLDSHSTRLKTCKSRTRLGLCDSAICAAEDLSLPNQQR